MEKSITRIVLTGGPAAGKTSLISRILKEFSSDSGWKVITIPETATELISDFGIRPFGNCLSMLDFQYFVISDQLHKEKLALKAAEMVPEDKVLIIYDRAILDDKAYISDEEFANILNYFGTDEDTILSGYDAVLHLVTCAKGAEFAYNYGNAARYEGIETAREKDDLTLRAWSRHPSLFVIDNSVDFEDKINRAIAQIYRIIGQSVPEVKKRKYLIEMPDTDRICGKYNAVPIDMMQTYLVSAEPNVDKRVRQQRSDNGYLYFYTERRTDESGNKWVVEKPISEKDYVSYIMDCDVSLHPVRKRKFRFGYESRRMEIDVYPFSQDKAVLFTFGDSREALPPEIKVIREVTGEKEYKNRSLAEDQKL